MLVFNNCIEKITNKIQKNLRTQNNSFVSELKKKCKSNKTS